MEAIMATSAAITQYRTETVKGFEQNQSLLRSTVTTESVIKGNTATFLVADSGGATATTRGINGLIPARNNSLTQTSATLVEKNDLVEMTNFNIFQSQGDQRRIMQDTSRAVINRDIDDVITTILNTGTVDTGTTTTANLQMVLRAKAILGYAKVPNDGNISAAVSPGFLAYLLQVPEFSNAEYVNLKPLVDDALGWRDMPQAFRWMNILWIEHPDLPGANTNAEKCFMYHRSAIGHAINMGDIDAKVGYEEKQNMSWARTTVYHGAALLQNAGVVVMNHDASAITGE
jgi:hypothetical protein